MNENKAIQFFVCSTIDGKYVGINLKQMQAVNILWEAKANSTTDEPYDGAINILLKGREDFIETNTDNYDQLCDFYQGLEYGSSIVGELIGFLDEDGEELLININELLYIESPKTIIDEGYEIIKEMDGIEE